MSEQRKPREYRKRPVVIKAIQWTGDNLAEVLDFTGKHPKWDSWFDSFDEYESHVKNDGSKFKILTLEGTMTADPGDWIIRGVNGEHYPCKPDIFEKSYELVDHVREVLPDADQATSQSPSEQLKQVYELLYGIRESLVGMSPTLQKDTDEVDRLSGMANRAIGFLMDERDRQVRGCDDNADLQTISIVFDGPPSHVSGRFIEVENKEGKSIKAGRWVEGDDGTWSLVLSSNDFRAIPADDDQGEPKDDPRYLSANPRDWMDADRDKIAKQSAEIERLTLEREASDASR